MVRLISMFGYRRGIGTPICRKRDAAQIQIMRANCVMAANGATISIRAELSRECRMRLRKRIFQSFVYDLAI